MTYVRLTNSVRDRYTRYMTKHGGRRIFARRLFDLDSILHQITLKSLHTSFIAAHQETTLKHHAILSPSIVSLSAISLLVVVSIFIPTLPLVQADTVANIGLPFGPCQTWYVFQGYNGYTHYLKTDTTGKVTFDNKYAFDLVKDAWGNLTGSGNTDVYAAASGTTTTWYGGAVHGWEVYIRLDDGRLIINSHLKDLPSTVGNGKRVIKGAFIGRVIDTKPGDVNHLHFHVAYNHVTLPLNFGAWKYPSPGPKASGGPNTSTGEWRGTKIESPCQPGAPILLGPANNATSSRRDISFQWRDSSVVSRNPHEFWVEVKNNTTGTTVASNWQRALDWTTTLPQNGVYSWRVKARDGTTESAWSEARFVTINEVAACPKKGQGDTDCNGTISLTDFELWRREYTGSDTTHNGDFDNDGRITLTDFERWRRGYNGIAAIQSLQSTSAIAVSDQPTLVVFAQPIVTVQPTQTAELDIVLRNTANIVSSANIVLQYPPNMLTYEEQPSDYASPTCLSVNASNNYAFQNRVVVENDSINGQLRIARLSTNVQLPSGDVCLGTVVFQVNPNLQLPAVASVLLATDTASWEVASAQVSVPYQFDPDQSVANIEISKVATPANVRVSATTTDTVTLEWDAAERDVTGYRVYQWNGHDAEGSEFNNADDTSIDQKLVAEVDSTTMNHTLIGIPCGTGAVYAISAIRDQDESLKSQWLSYTSQPCPLSNTYLPLLQH